MLIKFALYEIDTGNVFLLLPDIPDNDDYLDTGEIIYKGQRRTSGVKWENAEVWENDAGVELDTNHYWRYDADNEVFIDLGEIK